ncbi:hypothetical protein Tco_1322567 [Tanacetum coccineum]
MTNSESPELTYCRGCSARENVDYPELMWKDFAYQIDHRKEKRSRRENMPYPRFTKIIINHFLKQHKSLTNLNHKHYHTIKDDGGTVTVKFVRIGKTIRNMTSILSVIATDVLKRTVVSIVKVLNQNQKPVKMKKTSIRVVKNKVTLSADDNIISDDPDAAVDIAKSISQTEVEEAKQTRKVDADTARTKLKGATIPTPQEQEAADIMQALKESKKTSRRQPGTRGSNEGTGSKPGVPDESTFISTTSNETRQWNIQTNDNDDVEKDDKDGDADDEEDDHVNDTQDADDEDVKTESDEDEIYKYKIRVYKDEDVEMKDAEVEESDKGVEKVTDAAKEEAEKTSEAKHDTKKTELPPSSSSLSVSSGFGDQFLKLSSDSSLVSTAKDSADTNKVLVSVILETTNLPPIPEILTETPVSTTVSSPLVTPIISSVQQTPTPIPTPTITTDAPTITTAIPESNALTVVELRVAKLEKDMSELKTVDHSTEALAILKSQVPSVVDNYLGSKVRDVFRKELKKHTTDLIQKYSLQ